MKRKEEIQSKLESSELETPYIFSNGYGSPERKALDWLLDNDDAYLCEDDTNLIQRFSLAVFYFSTNGFRWASCSGINNVECDGANAFLSRHHECSWFGIKCNSKFEVTQLTFGKVTFKYQKNQSMH